MRAAPWVVVLSAVVACSDDEPQFGAGETEAAAPPGANAASAPLADTAADELRAVVTPDGATTRLTRPGPHRARGADAVRANAACESCHAPEAKEWRASRHRAAETNAAYRRAFSVEPTAFCRGCHAPEAPPALDVTDPTRPPERAVAELGVGCVTCHVIGAIDDAPPAVLAAPRAGADRNASAPHDVVRSADFGATGACVSCHEFTFPGREGGPQARPDADFMQTTVREHAASSSSDRPCASCHMPEARGRRTHDFGATRDPAWLRASIQASAAIGPVGAAVVTVRALGVGHAAPTGDLFRRIEVGAERVDARGRVVQRDVRWLARHFEIRAGERARTLVRDDRLRDAAAEIDLDVECPAEGTGERVRWWITYQRVAETHRGDVPADADIESEVRLHEGSLCDAPAPRRLAP